MRIEWHEDSAHAVARSLWQVQEALEEGRQMSSEVFQALNEADPDSSNRRLQVLRARFEAAVKKLSDLERESDELRGATEGMIQSFERSESEAVRTLRSLEAGTKQEEQGPAGITATPAPRPVRPRQTPPMPLPRPRIAPVMRLNPMGPILEWLMALLYRQM